MFNVQGKCFLTNIKEVSPKLLTATAYTFKKVGDDFEPTFIRAKIIGNALVNIITLGIMDKDTVMIDSAVLGTNKWTDKNGNEHTSIEMTIFELSEFVKEDLITEPKKDNKKSKFKR